MKTPELKRRGRKSPWSAGRMDRPSKAIRLDRGHDGLQKFYARIGLYQITR